MKNKLGQFESYPRPLLKDGLIPLTQNKVAVVDLQDYKNVKQYNWCFDASKGYAVARINGKNIRLHRFLLQPQGKMQIDHINGDKLDNRRQNLRLATHNQNLVNSKIRSDNCSGYKGVGFSKDNNLWRARIKGKWLGYFKTAKEAAFAYDNKAREIYGKFAKLNFAAGSYH